MATFRTGLILAVAVAIAASPHFLTVSGQAVPKPESQSQSAAANPHNGAAQSTPSLELPVSFERRVGDLDGMVKRRQIRVLVIPSRSGFFYDKGQPHGIYYEAFDEFQRFVNSKYKNGSLKVSVTYLPVRIEQLEQALLQGMGDVIGFPLIVTPERQQVALFTTPIDPDVKQVIVTGPKMSQITTLEDLSGKEVYANPLTVYYENLQRLSESLQKAGKPPILVKAAVPI